MREDIYLQLRHHLSTLRNQEQGRRKLDNTAIACLKAIMKFPKDVHARTNELDTPCP